MRIPDWVVYAVVLVVIVGTLFSSGSGDNDKSWVFRDEAIQTEPEFPDRGRTPAASDGDVSIPRSSDEGGGLRSPAPIRSTSACLCRWAMPRTALVLPSPSISPAPG